MSDVTHFPARPPAGSILQSGEPPQFSPLDGTIQWYAIYTKKHKEHYADIKLLQAGVETFLPLILAPVRRKMQLRPLFPCYLFARFDAGRWLYSFNHLEGVNKVVSFNGRPIPVDPAIIAGLRSRMGEAGCLVQTASLVEAGQRVRLRGGLFDGYEGKIEELRPRDRVVVLLNTIVSRARLEIDRNMLELIREYTGE